MEDVHRLAGDQPDDVLRVKDVEGDSQAPGHAVILVHNAAGRLGEVVLRGVGVFVEVVVDRVDAVLLAGQLGDLLRLAEAAGSVAEVVGKGADNAQRHLVAFTGVLLDVVHRAGDVVQHVINRRKRGDEAGVREAHASCQADDGGVPADDVAQDRRLGLQGADDRLHPVRDRLEVGDHGPQVIGNKGTQVQIEIVVAHLRRVLPGRPGDAHRVAYAGNGGSDAAPRHLQLEIDVHADRRRRKRRLEQGRWARGIDLGQSQLSVVIGVG